MYPYFKSYDALRMFLIVARHLSFTAAGNELNLTKGAVGYQVKQLEQELGFSLFTRMHSGIVLTEKGKRLWHVAHLAFQEVEQEITSLREATLSPITIGASTYFASRWLSQRLMTFITEYPHICLRLQPVIGLGDFQADQIDLMIRWGKADWNDVETELLFRCPAIATAGVDTARQIDLAGLVHTLPTLTLLHDREKSNAWREWYKAVGLPYRPKQDCLVIPDPNVRVQAVINEQGIALNDSLISAEIENGQLFKISSAELQEYGYFLSYPSGALNNPDLSAFREWILGEARREGLALLEEAEGVSSEKEEYR